ncbi:MAG TPA: SHOCT domain-containing protein [Candidatus Limnocylindria bacterium]|nr:SHOCT domain-containing protein [Candidatus Limnocylindria bacterium]
MGLIKTAAKVAVASSVHGRVQRRQQQRWAADDQAASATTPPAALPPSAPASPPDRITQLKDLGSLRDSGVLSEAEFEAEKARILQG